MNADLHMAGELKNTGKGNLFVIFGEPDIDILPAANSQVSVKINGVDVFHPNTGEVRSDGAEGIACWFIDTDYNEEELLCAARLFPGSERPCQRVKTTLKARRSTKTPGQRSTATRPAPLQAQVGPHRRQGDQPPGDEVMKVFKVT
jgi:adenine-specific DNA-methyltransferase